MSRKYLKLFHEPVIDRKNFTEEKKHVCLMARKYKKILEVAVYLETENPVYRIFFEGDDFTTYITGDDKFSKKNIFDLDYYLSGYTAHCDEKSVNLIRKYMHADVEEDSIFLTIYNHQQSIKRKKLEKKHLQEEEMLDEKMKIFRKPIPKGYGNFLRNKVFDNDFVLFYFRKDDTAYCTKCGTWHKYSEMPDKPKIGKQIECPSCRTKVRCRARVTENGIIVCKWSLLVQTDGEDKVLFRYFCHSLSIKGTEPGVVRTVELQRTISDVYGRESFMWDDFHSTGKTRWCTYHDPSGIFTPSMWKYPTKGIYVYGRGLDKVLNVKGFQYSVFDLFCKAAFFPNAYTPENYLYQYLKKPYLEKLIKVGFINIASYLMDPWYGEQLEKRLNRNSKDVKGLLDIDGRTFKRMVNLGNPSYEDYRIFKEFSFLNDRNLMRLKGIPKVNLRAEQIRKILMSDGITPAKFIGYIEKHCFDNIDIYIDYLECRAFLGYPNTHEYLYPKDLMTMHDRFSEEKAVLMEQKRREELEQKSREMALLIGKMEQEARFHMEDDSYTIVLPKDYAALHEESKVLNHCVKNYIDEINNGHTMIFFIRKKEAVEKPFFTLEINKDLNLVQCRTKHNKRADEFDKEKGTHVQLFAESFQRQLVNTAYSS